MKQNLFENEDLTDKDKVDSLEAMNYKIEANYTFQRPFSFDELKDKRESITNVSMQIDEQEEQLREISKQKREVLKGLKSEQKIIMKEVRAQAETVTETVYLLDDQEEGIMGYYDANGTLISSRKLLPGERNLKIEFGNKVSNG